MMREIVGKNYRSIEDRTGQFVIDGICFRRCIFADCLLMTDSADNRPRVRNVELLDCEERGASINYSFIEEVRVDGLRTKDLFILADCAFKHVRIEGRVGRIKITNGFASLFKKQKKMQADLNAQNSRFYETVDWAIDISHAEFEECDIDFVPLDLIRRDEETQVILPTEVIKTREWCRVRRFAEVWGKQIEALVASGLGSELLLVAGKRHKDFDRELSGLRAIREAGLVR